MPTYQLDTLVAILHLFVEHPLDFFLPDDSSINHGNSEFVQSLEIQLPEDTFFYIDVGTVQFRINFENLFALVYVVKIHHA